MIKFQTIIESSYEYGGTGQQCAAGFIEFMVVNMLGQYLFKAMEHTPRVMNNINMNTSVGGIENSIHPGIIDIFSSEWRQTYECSCCNKIWHKSSHDFVTKVVIPSTLDNNGGSVSLEKCLNETCYGSEYLDEYICHFCHKIGNVKLSKPKFIRSGKVMIFHLLRFYHSGTYDRYGNKIMLKNNVKIDIPQLLDMNNYMKGGKQCKKHRLHSGINHLGPIREEGHYIANCFEGDGKSGVCYNDETIKNITFNGKSASSYILVYEETEYECAAVEVSAPGKDISTLLLELLGSSNGKESKLDKKVQKHHLD